MTTESLAVQAVQAVPVPVQVQVQVPVAQAIRGVNNWPHMKSIKV